MVQKSIGNYRRTQKSIGKFTYNQSTDKIWVFPIEFSRWLFFLCSEGLEDYRLISLEGSVYKLVSKILSKRLQNIYR